MDFTPAGRFRSEGNFDIIFAAYFAAAKRAHDVVKWHSCAKGWFLSCEAPFEMASQLRSGGFQVVEISQPFRSCEMGVLGCKMALMCQGVSLQLRKFSQRALGGYEMVSQRKLIFAARRGFSQRLLRATKFFHSERQFSQQPTLGCEISQTMLSPCF